MRAGSGLVPKVPVVPPARQRPAADPAPALDLERSKFPILPRTHRPGNTGTREDPLVPVDPAGGGLTVQETAERTGLSEHTLRYSLLEEQACEVEDRMRAM